MQSGRLAALACAACLAASCGAPSAAASVNRAPSSPSPGGTATPAAPSSGAASPVATAAAPSLSAPPPSAPVVPPKGDQPVRVPPPKVSPYTYTFPVKECKSTYARKLLVLPKTTIWAARGCAFVSPVDGVVTEVSTKNLWTPATDRGQDREGRFVAVRGKDGVLYLGGHLDSIEPGILPGARVYSGQPLGKIGNSGNARDTATNLYFAISWPVGPEYWWIRRGMVKPWTYLDAWDVGNRTLSPRRETLTLREKLGATPACDQLCAVAAPPPAAPPTTPTKKPAKPRPHHSKPPVYIPL